MAKLGLIQVRGLGDCVIILPMAEYFSNQGHEVFIALDDRFCEQFQEVAPYCTFVPVPFSAFNGSRGIYNEYWYELPRKILLEKGCDQVISFPQHDSIIINRSTTNSPEHEFIRKNLTHRVMGALENKAYHAQTFKHLKFDEYKYNLAQVPFKIKWNLNLKRNHKREEELYEKLVDKNKKQIVAHLDGSNFKIDPKHIEYDVNKFQLINIEPGITSNIFDWLLILEKASTVVTIDSVFFNLIDQLNFTNEKYFIRRSPIESTPVMGNVWKFINIQIEDKNHLYG